jgi:hypothetical protein
LECLAVFVGIRTVTGDHDRPEWLITINGIRTISKLKRFKRVAMRCEKTDISYSAIISFACGLMLVKSVYTA